MEKYVKITLLSALMSVSMLLSAQVEMNDIMLGSKHEGASFMDINIGGVKSMMHVSKTNEGLCYMFRVSPTSQKGGMTRISYDDFLLIKEAVEDRYRLSFEEFRLSNMSMFTASANGVNYTISVTHYPKATLDCKVLLIISNQKLYNKVIKAKKKAKRRNRK